MKALLVSRGMPITVLSWKSSIKLVYFRNRSVFPLLWHDKYIRSATIEWRLPSVIMVSVANVSPYLSLTRKNVYIRDDYTCQWCGKHYGTSELSIDHVLPVSRGGTNTWRNVVTSCRKCNNQKGNLTGEEYEQRFNKRLLNRPIVANRKVLFKKYLIDDRYEAWSDFIL